LGEQARTCSCFAVADC